MSETRPEAQSPLFPLAGPDVGRSKVNAGAVLLRLLYQGSPRETEPTGALLHSLTPEQARELARELFERSPRRRCGRITVSRR